MKISEMTTGQAADALVRISEPAAEIANDEKVWKVIEVLGGMKESKTYQQMAFLLRDVVPVLLKDHRNALYTVLSVLTEKSVKEIDQQSIGITIKDIRESFDEDLLSFFTQSTGQSKDSGKE